MKNSPCYNCQNRKAVCHATCAAYREWAAAVRKANDDERKANAAAAYAKDNRERWRRRRNLK